MVFLSSPLTPHDSAIRLADDAIYDTVEQYTKAGLVCVTAYGSSIHISRSILTVCAKDMFKHNYEPLKPLCPLIIPCGTGPFGAPRAVGMLCGVLYPVNWRFAGLDTGKSSSSSLRVRSMIWDAGRLLLVDACIDVADAEASREDIGGVLAEPKNGTGVLAIFKAETLESLISISSSSSLPKLVLLLFGDAALLF